MFRPTTSSSPMSSRCLTSATRLLPWAATSTVAPLRRSGTIASYQYGSIRTTTAARHEGRRRCVVRAAPHHQLLLAVLGDGGRLVRALQRSVVPLVEPPGAA